MVKRGERYWWERRKKCELVVSDNRKRREEDRLRRRRELLEQVRGVVAEAMDGDKCPCWIYEKLSSDLGPLPGLRVDTIRRRWLPACGAVWNAGARRWEL